VHFHDSAERDDVFPQPRDFLKRSGVKSAKEAFFNRCDIFTDMVEHRKDSAEERLENGVEEHTCLASHALTPARVALVRFFPQAPERIHAAVVDGDEVIFADKKVHFFFPDFARFAVKDGKKQDEEQVASVVGEFWLLRKRRYVLVVKLMERKMLPQVRNLGLPRILNVNPAFVFGMDDFEIHEGPGGRVQGAGFRGQGLGGSFIIF
jgi:hypothetical protein